VTRPLESAFFMEMEFLARRAMRGLFPLSHTSQAGTQRCRRFVLRCAAR
jgi:hypothetical protein